MTWSKEEQEEEMKKKWRWWSDRRKREETEDGTMQVKEMGEQHDDEPKKGGWVINKRSRWCAAAFCCFLQSSCLPAQMPWKRWRLSFAGMLHQQQDYRLVYRQTVYIYCEHTCMPTRGCICILYIYASLMHNEHFHIYLYII